MRTRSRERVHAWERGQWVWHAFYGTVLATALVLTLVEDEAPTTSKIVVGGLLVGFALWYALVGRAAMSTCSAWLAPTYLAGAFALFVPTYLLAPWTGILLAALCPQCFMMLPVRRAVVACVAFNGLPAAMLLAAVGWRVEALAGVAAAFAVTIACSAAFGTWISSIITQSSKRADLIEKLEASQAEVERLSHEKGALAERERLATEIHDTLAQGFTSILMLVQAAQAHVDRDSDEVRRHLDLAGTTARENLAETRALVAALRPVDLESTPLPEALARLTDRLGDELGVGTGFTTEGAVRPLAAGAEVVLLRACQEGLANVRKHAGASTVRVRLAYDDGHARLQLGDDGVGFEPARLNGGFGMAGMRARVEQVGGRVRVASTPGSGTMITVEVPS